MARALAHRSKVLRLFSRPAETAEALLWLVGLAAVAAADPDGAGLISACPFDAVGTWLGVSFCPGCGLGHAVGHLARGEFAASFAAHPLGFPAVAVLSHRILHLMAPVLRPRTHV